jgi:hypothetical protein
MQRSAFSFFLLALLLVLGLSSARASAPASTKDTIVVRLPNQAILTLMVRDASQLRDLHKYHLDSLTTRLAGYINQAEAAAKTSSNEQVTMEFYPDKDKPGQNLPEQIRITTRKKDANRVDVFLNKTFGVQVIDSPTGKNYEFGHSDKKPAADSTKKHHDSKSSTVFLRLDVGLNALVNQKPYFNATNNRNETVELRTWGSRYVNFGLNYSQRLGGKHTPLRLNFGPELAIYSYMLEGNNKWALVDGRTEVIKETNASHQFDRTKLSVTTLNLPVMFELGLKNKRGKTAFHLGAGGFVGLRTGSHTRTTYTFEGKDYDDRDEGRYNLETVQYGVQGLIGYRALSLFAKYHMNNLFEAGKGPEAQAISFGLQIFGI